MRWRRLAVVVLVVLSGCSTPFGGAPETTTVTPAAVPEGPSDSFAPGVTNQGVVTTPLLVAAHNRSLHNQSFTVVFNRTRLHYGEFRDRLVIVAAVDRRTDSYRIRVQHVRPVAPTVETLLVKSNDTVTRIVRSGNGTGTRETFSAPDRPLTTFDPTLTERFRRVLESVAIERVEPQRPGAAVYELTGSEAGNQSLLVGSRDQLQSVRLVAQIRSSGRLQRYTRIHSFVRGRTNVTLVERGSVLAVGQTQVNTTLPKSGS